MPGFSPERVDELILGRCVLELLDDINTGPFDTEPWDPVLAKDTLRSKDCESTSEADAPAVVNSKFLLFWKGGALMELFIEPGIEKSSSLDEFSCERILDGKS